MTRKLWHHAAQSRHERGYGHQWTKTRAIIIARDMGLCQPCKRKGRPTPYDAVDHILAKSAGGTDDHENLQLICTACHRDKTQAESLTAQGKQAKPRIAYTADGRVIWP